MIHKKRPARVSLPGAAYRLRNQSTPAPSSMRHAAIKRNVGGLTISDPLGVAGGGGGLMPVACVAVASWTATALHARPSCEAT